MDTLSLLYRTLPGRVILKGLISPPVSALSGAFLDAGVSRLLIKLFVRKNHIDVREFDLSGVRSFNDFFCRPLKPGRRPVDMEKNHLIAPCDGLLSVYPIRKDTVFPVKQVPYTLLQLLRSPRLAEAFEGGYCFVYRLCVQHYHRYCYVDSGRKSASVCIPGVFHTVRPVALETVPVFARNAREYVMIRSAAFGPVLQMEVGAMLVGKICNHREESAVRGREKGMFKYGGSTIVVLTGKDAVEADPDLLRASSRGEETPVRMGQTVGRKKELYDE